MLQKQHPDIALSIKTRQAVRSVLNNLRDGIHELLSDGILEEAEGVKLEKVKIPCNFYWSESAEQIMLPFWWIEELNFI